MPRAVCLVRDPPHYRRDAMLAGLAKAGYQVVQPQVLTQPKPADLLVIWNRYAEYDQMATKFEKWGAGVIVCENGYVGHHDNENGKPVAANGEALYAMALNRHNGAGAWHVGEPGRAEAQGIATRPWREDGEHILVLAQRGIGLPPVASPRDWTERTERRLKKLTHRPVKVRGHPGNAAARVPLARDLEGAWCAVTWASSAGIRAMAMGYPVYTDFDQWIGRPCAQLLANIGYELPDLEDSRQIMLNRIAWAQWTPSEIATGEPFERLMELHAMREPAA